MDFTSVYIKLRPLV